MAGLHYNINDLFQEAKKRWLKPIEVFYILKNHDMCEFTDMPLNRPRGNILILFIKFDERIKCRLFWLFVLVLLIVHNIGY
jgi:hypothetical protein